MKSEAYEVLKIRDFRHWVLARTAITFGVNVLGTVVGWQVYETLPETMDTRSKALALGYIGLAEFIPFLLVTLFGGYIADILDRKKIIQTCVTLYAACALMLFLLSFKFTSIFQAYGVMPIYIIISLTGLIRGFLGPAQSAFAAQLVPPQLFTNATTWSTMSWHISAIGGPAVGGLLYGFTHNAWSSYLLVTGLSLVGLLLILTISSRHEVSLTEGVKKEGLTDSVKVGMRFVFNNQVILGSLALDMFAVLFGGAVALLPAFAKDVLHTGPEGLGILRASPAAGAVIMSFILAYYPPIKQAGRLLLYSVAGFGICTILFAVSKNFWFSALMLAGTGFFDNVSMVIRGTIIQLFTPNEMRGRVSAVNSIFIGSSNELGAFESGVAARLLGLTPSVIFGGVMTLLVVFITWFKAPILREMDLKKE